MFPLVSHGNFSAVLLFVGRRCFASTGCVCVRFSSSRNVHLSCISCWLCGCESFAIEVFIRTKAHQFFVDGYGGNFAAHAHTQRLQTRTSYTGWACRAQCECMIRGDPRFTYYCSVFIVFAMVNKSERINTYKLSPSICASKKLKKLKGCERINKRKLLHS